MGRFNSVEHVAGWIPDLEIGLRLVPGVGATNHQGARARRRQRKLRLPLPKAVCSLIGTKLGRLPACTAIDRQIDAGNAARVANREALHERLEASLRAEPAAHWVRALTAVRVPAGEVNDIAGAFELARTLGMQPIVDVPAPDGSTVSLTRNPIALSRTPPSYRSAPPALPE